MTTLEIHCPDQLPLALGKRPEDAAREVQLMAAIKLFECGRLSSGMAAELAGMDRIEFLQECGRYGVTVFQQNSEELARDIENALETSRR